MKLGARDICRKLVGKLRQSAEFSIDLSLSVVESPAWLKSTLYTLTSWDKQ